MGKESETPSSSVIRYRFAALPFQDETDNRWHGAIASLTATAVPTLGT
jgi:hypothetical protein